MILVPKEKKILKVNSTKVNLKEYHVDLDFPHKKKKNQVQQNRPVTSYFSVQMYWFYLTSIFGSNSP